MSCACRMARSWRAGASSRTRTSSTSSSRPETAPTSCSETPSSRRACEGVVSAICQDVMKRSERLFALAEHLRGRRTGVTAESLAERFGVTIRTIYRDLDTLRAADLPLTAERGRGGGYALDRSYTLPPVNFTAREAALLIALGRFAIDMRLLPFG